MRYSLMATVAKSVLLGACGTASHSSNMAMTVDTASPAAKPLSIVPMGEYRTGLFDEGAAEIPAYAPASKRIFVVNGGEKAIDILDMSNPDKLAKLGSIKLATWGKAANSVAIHGNIVAAAVENDDKQAPGKAVFFDTNGDFIAAVTVGALPDMIKFTPDGKYVLVANEGEPNDAFDNDPEGSTCASAAFTTAGPVSVTASSRQTRRAATKMQMSKSASTEWSFILHSESALAAWGAQLAGILKTRDVIALEGNPFHASASRA